MSPVSVPECLLVAGWIGDRQTFRSVLLTYDSITWVLPNNRFVLNSTHHTTTWAENSFVTHLNDRIDGKKRKKRSSTILTCRWLTGQTNGDWRFFGGGVESGREGCSWKPVNVLIYGELFWICVSTRRVNQAGAGDNLFALRNSILPKNWGRPQVAFNRTWTCFEEGVLFLNLCEAWRKVINAGIWRSIKWYINCWESHSQYANTKIVF